MKKLITVLLLATLLISHAAFANYQLIYTAKENTKFYVDLSSRIFTGSFIKVWEYQNYGAITDTGSMSARGLSEYDCDKKEWRTLSVTSYSKPNLGGVVVAQLKKDKADWQKAVNGQANMFLLNKVCKVNT